MSEPLKTKIELWGFNPTCKKKTYELPSGEVVFTEITRPDADVQSELAERAARKAKRAAFVAAIMPSRLDSMAWKLLATEVAGGAPNRFADPVRRGPVAAVERDSVSA